MCIFLEKAPRMTWVALAMVWLAFPAAALADEWQWVSAGWVPAEVGQTSAEWRNQTTGGYWHIAMSFFTSEQVQRGNAMFEVEPVTDQTTTDCEAECYSGTDYYIVEGSPPFGGGSGCRAMCKESYHIVTRGKAYAWAYWPSYDDGE